MNKYLHTIWLLCALFPTALVAQNYTQQVTAIQYYFNADPGTGVAGNGAIVPVSPAGTISQALDITLPGGLPQGSNQLYIRVKDEWGRWSIAERRSLFIVTPAVTEDISAIQYYFNTDPGTGVAGNGAVIPITPGSSISQSLAISLPPDLPEGPNHLYIRVMDEAGRWSIAERKTIYMIAPVAAATFTALQYFFDTDPGVGIPGNGGIIEVQATDTLTGTYAFMVPGILPGGIHSLYTRVRYANGTWSHAERRQFVAGECTPAGLDNLMSWWPFDAVSSTAVDDVAGNREGILVNGAATSLYAIFDGVDDYIGVADPDTIWDLDTILPINTIEFLANFQSVGGDLAHPGNKFIGQSEGAGNAKKWTFAHGGGMLFFRLSDGNTSQDLVQFPFNPNLGQWYHIALTRSGDTLRTYIDGAAAGYQVVPGLNIPYVNAPLTIGHVEWVQGGDQGYMHGSLDEMSIHGKALTAAEIGELAEAGMVGKCKDFRVTTPALSDALLGQPYSATLNAMFGVTPYAWAIIGGQLPDGLSLNESGEFTGTPSVAGSFSFTVQATDVVNATAQKEFSINVLLTLPAPRVSLFKSGTQAVPGREMDYFILVENVGSVADTIQGVELLEPWFIYTSSNPPAEIVAFTPNHYTLEDTDSIPSIIRWKVFLEPGESVVLSYKVKLQPTFPIGEPVTGPFCWENITPDDAGNCWWVYNSCLIVAGTTSAVACAPAWAAGPAAYSACYYANLAPRIAGCWAAYLLCLLGNSYGDEPCTEDSDTTDAPLDPNEKLVLAEKFIQPDKLLPYVVHFENIGTIEALDVFITDTLDTNLDETTLNILSQEGSSFDTVTRVLRWDLLDINLLPDSSGYVLFTARPKPGLPSGTVIRNKASIQFEVFDIFTTNETENIIDHSVPEGVMVDLPDTIYQTSFPVYWSGFDSVGEIKHYSVFVATDTGAFVPLISYTKDTMAYFTGETGKTYHFICIAEDLAGNIEVQEPVAETSTFLDVLCTYRFFPDLDGDGFGNGDHPSLSCSQPAGYVSDSTDCNDRNGAIHPGAAEVCNYIDDDCDGEIDETRLPVSITVTASANPVNSGEVVVFTAQPVNGGMSPGYQWYVGGDAVAGATGNSYAYLPADGDTVTCRLTSSDTCVSGNPAYSEPVVMTVNPTVPATISLLNLTVPNGSSVCYNATQEIVVAGPGSGFLVQEGAFVLMKAGQRISFLEGTIVEPGGFLHGMIVTGGPWCGSGIGKHSVAEETVGRLRGSDEGFFRVYPNPFSNTFSVSFDEPDESTEVRVDLFGMRGEVILSATLTGQRTHSFSLEGRGSGVYFVRVVTPERAGTAKIIKK